MRPPTVEEKPFAEYVEDIEGLGSIFVYRLSVLSQYLYVGAWPLTINNTMGLRAVRKRAQAMMEGKTIMCLCRPEEEQEQKFVEFMGFRRVDEVRGFVRYVRT